MRNKIIVFFLLFSFTAVSKLFASALNDAIVQKTFTWNKLNTEQNIKDLEKMYTESVIGYGVKSSASKFMEAKAKFFKWAESFTQTIVSDFTIKKYKEGQVVCEFEKQITYKGKTKNYPSYLVFKKQGGDYLIEEEGDAITDANTGHKLQLGELKSIDSIALDDIRTTSFTLPVIIGVSLILLLGFLVFFYRRNHLRSKKVIRTQQLHAKLNDEQSHCAGQKTYTEPKSDQVIQKEKGDQFEKFILRSFNPKYFKLIDWTGDKGVDGIYAISNQNPDLLMQLNLNEGPYQFAVECKWRTKLPDNDKIEICSSDQLDRYKAYGKRNKIEVFLALGVGGKPEFPERLYVVPLRDASHPVVKSHFIEKYRKEPGSFFFYNVSSATLV